MTTYYPTDFTPCVIKFNHREGTQYSVTLIDDLAGKRDVFHVHLPLHDVINEHRYLMGFSSIANTFSDLSIEEYAETYVQLHDDHRAMFVYPLDYKNLCAMVTLTGVVDDMTQEVTQEIKENEHAATVCQNR